jgi:acetyltransferase-like isoleucine patch superfamily enzyme
MIKIRSKIYKAKIGKKVVIVEPVNIYNCAIKDNSFIGPFVEIQKNSIIGKSCRVQSHTFICEKVEIGDNCFIGHGVIFVNDKFSKGGPSGKNNIVSTIVGNNVSIGSNSTILPIKICSNVVIGAGSVVTKNILKSGFYVGNPAKFLKKISKKC